MIDYYFKINAVDVHTELNGLEKVVYNVHYSYVGKDENGNIDSVIGVISVDAPDAENFKPYDSLIQADVICWIEPLIDVEPLKVSIANKIAELVAPTKLTLYVPESLDSQETTA